MSCSIVAGPYPPAGGATVTGAARNSGSGVPMGLRSSDIVIIRRVILIVDDDPAVRFMLRLWLEELDQDIEEVDSGEAALERCREREFDVVVLDQRMPDGMSGIDVARELKERGYGAVVLLHSAYLDRDLEAQAAGLGIDTIEKGDDLGLRAAVTEALGAQ